jgi:hypothetical protein
VISGGVGGAAAPRLRGPAAAAALPRNWAFQRDDNIADTLQRAISRGAPTYNGGDHGAAAEQLPSDTA